MTPATKTFAFAAAAALALGGAALWGPPAAAQGQMGPSNTEVECRRVIEQQMSALNVENPQGAMMLFHPKCPDRDGMLRSLVDQFRRYDLRYKLKEAVFIGEEPGTYAYMRVKQTVDGSHEKRPFKGETELLLVFRKDKNGWKAWTSAHLSQETKPINTGPGPRQPGPRKR